MARIYKIKTPPVSILHRFRDHYGYDVDFDFYYYFGQSMHKCYGANVYKNGQLYSNSYQIYL